MNKEKVRTFRYQLHGKVIATGVVTSDCILRDIRHYDNGKICSGRLVGPALIRIGPYALPAQAGSYINFDQEGKPTGMLDHTFTSVILAQDIPFKIGRTTHSLKKDMTICFSYNEKIQFIRLHEPSTFRVGGRELIFYKDRFDNATVTFHPTTGQVREAALGKTTSFRIDGRSFSIQVKTEIRFDKHGMFIPDCIVIAADKQLQVGKYSIKAKRHKGLSFYPDHSIARATLADDTELEINGEKLMFAAKVPGEIGTTYMDFHENHEVKSGVLKEDTWITVGKERILFSGGQRIEFHDNGVVSSGMLAEEPVLTVGTYQIKFSTKNSYDESIHFSKEGSVLAGDLAEKVSLEVGPTELTFTPQIDDRGMTVRDIDPRDGHGHTYDMYFYEDGSIKSGAIAENTQLFLGDVPVLAASKEGSFYTYEQYRYCSVDLYPDGSLRQCTLAEDLRWRQAGLDILLAKGKRVKLFKNGTIKRCSLKEPGTFRYGEAHFSLAPNTADNDLSTEFYPDGYLKRGKLSKDLKITLFGRPMELQFGSTVSFFEDHCFQDGKLRSDETVTVDGITFTIKAGKDFEFHPNGTLHHCFLAKPIKLLRHNYELTIAHCGYGHFGNIFFEDTGTLRNASIISGSVTFGEITVPVTDHVYFHSNGRISGIKLAEDAAIFGRAFKKNDQLEFDENGELKDSSTSEDLDDDDLDDELDLEDAE